MRTLALVCVALALVAAGAAAAREPSTRWRTLHVGGETLLVGTPSWYSPTNDPPLPLVISPHARGGSAAKNARRWGDVPGRRGLIVLAPSLHGRVLDQTRTWGYPPAIETLVRTPEIMRRRLPWVRWDPNRVYAAGFSMGGQEALLALALRPDMFAAVSVADSVTDFVRRWYEFPLSPLTRAEQAKETREVGGTPRQVPWLYRRRSPATFARTIAFSGVPVQLWWNPREDVVVHQSTTQSGAFVRLLKRLNSAAPVAPVVHSAPHGWVFRAGHSLDAMVDFLLAHRRAAPPKSGFSYVSWRRRVSVWGWSFRSGDVGHGFWRVDGVTASGFRSSSPSWLVVRPPGERGVRVAPGSHLVRRGESGWAIRPPRRS